jgi:hypothetical protein
LNYEKAAALFPESPFRIKPGGAFHYQFSAREFFASSPNLIMILGAGSFVIPEDGQSGVSQNYCL